MKKFYININAESDEYLWIYAQNEQGQFINELGNGAGWIENPVIADLKEIPRAQYDKILDLHVNYTDDFDDQVLHILKGVK